MGPRLENISENTANLEITELAENNKVPVTLNEEKQKVEDMTMSTTTTEESPTEVVAVKEPATSEVDVIEPAASEAAAVKEPAASTSTVKQQTITTTPNNSTTETETFNKLGASESHHKGKRPTIMSPNQTWKENSTHKTSSFIDDSYFEELNITLQGLDYNCTTKDAYFTPSAVTPEAARILEELNITLRGPDYKDTTEDTYLTPSAVTPEAARILEELNITLRGLDYNDTTDDAYFTPSALTPEAARILAHLPAMVLKHKYKPSPLIYPSTINQTNSTAKGKVSYKEKLNAEIEDETQSVISMVQYLKVKKRATKRLAKIKTQKGSIEKLTDKIKSLKFILQKYKHNERELKEYASALEEELANIKLGRNSV